jgi:folate-binding protein YgfZ
MAVPEQYDALRTGAGLWRRTDRGRLWLTGADRRAFLHGILTNDIAALTPGTGCYAAYLTPNGRMISDMRVFELGDAILVDLPAAQAASIRDRWDMLIFSEDVQVADVTGETAQIGVYGPRAAGVLARALGAVASSDEPVPDAEALLALPVHGSGRWDAGGVPATIVRSNDLGVGGFDVIVASDAAAAVWDRLVAAGAVPVEGEVLEVTRIEAGIPKFGVDMTEDTIPLEAGIEDRAISLTKGCYVGQEIIIRVLHRGGGRVAKRLVGLDFEPSAGVPSAGDRIAAGGREVGAVTSAAWSPAQERPIALGYVHRDFVEPGTRVDVGESETAATVTRLPFAARLGQP